MNTIKIDKKNCKINAHRGMSGIEKENTCAAFIVAGNSSVFGIETDVHLTKDGKFIFVGSDAEAEKYIGRKADKNRKIYNGMMKTYFYQFLGPKPPKRVNGDGSVCQPFRRKRTRRASSS